MISQVLDSLCLAHHPRWIEVSYAKGWAHLVCSNCGEPVTCRTNKIPKECPNCKENMTERGADGRQNNFVESSD